MITNFISEKTGWEPVPEGHDTRYHNFNNGGFGCEMGEFLYGFIKITKPEHILEAGTQWGIASSYMGLACKHNNFGNVTTLDPFMDEDSIERFSHITEKLELTDIVKHVSIKSLDFQPNKNYDLVFLDTEPFIKFQEVKKYFNYINPSGYIIMHDANRNLSWNCINTDKPDYKHWPLGDFRSSLGPLLKLNKIQIISFPGARDTLILQKKDENMNYMKFINGKLPKVRDEFQ